MKENVKKPKSKARKIIEWVATIILGLVFCFAAVCNIAKATSKNDYGYGSAFGYGAYNVLTDSMEPVYKVGTAIITYRDEPEEILKKWNEIKDLNLASDDERAINLTFVDAYSVKVNSGFTEYYEQTGNVKDDAGNYMVMTHQLFNIKVDATKEEGQGRYQFFVHGINTESEHQSKKGQYQVFTEKELLGVVKMNSAFIGAITKFIGSIWGLLICLLIPCLYLVISSILDLYKAYKMEDGDESTEAKAPEGTNMDNISEQEYEKLKQQMLNEMLNGKDEKK